VSEYAGCRKDCRSVFLSVSLSVGGSVDRSRDGVSSFMKGVDGCMDGRCFSAWVGVRAGIGKGALHCVALAVLSALSYAQGAVSACVNNSRFTLCPALKYRRTNASTFMMIAAWAPRRSLCVPTHALHPPGFLCVAVHGSSHPHTTNTHHELRTCIPPPNSRR